MLHLTSPLLSIGAILLSLTGVSALPADMQLAPRWSKGKPIAPRVLIITMFSYERNVWMDSDLDFSVDVTVPGLSPLYPDVACRPDLKICVMTTGESEINAATSTTALFFSPLFDFRLTYHLITGIAGVNPYEGTLGSAMFARFAIQWALMYELDAREMPPDWSTGY